MKKPVLQAGFLYLGFPLKVRIYHCLPCETPLTGPIIVAFEPGRRAGSA